MPPLAIAAALASACIHASWNALLKSGRDRLADSFFVALGSLICALLLIAFAGPPNAAAWPYLVASAAAHALYWAALIRGYELGDLSHVYTISRGAAPSLVAIGAAFAAREIPSFGDALGILLVSIGVMCVGVSPNAPLKATLWALLTACIIATYSLIDGLGARATGDVALYFGWMTLFMAIPLGGFALFRRGLAPLLRDAKSGAWRGLIAGIFSTTGYGLVVWAQSIAPIGQTIALRETSVVFAALISWLFLKEAMGPRRWLGAAIVAAGALTIGFSS
ncbi:MAG: EamA family transporter [Hyphomonadaceae bacterium]|nr:EamA family transporter [Hyphomonadaceae bacterium]